MSQAAASLSADSPTSFKNLEKNIPPQATSTLIISLAAIQKNYQFLQGLLGHATAGAVVKADAYGLGARRVAPALAAAGCRHFFVAHVDEGIAVRAALPPDVKVYVLTGPFARTESLFAGYKLIPVLNSLACLQRWRDFTISQSAPLPAILQFNTGMCRNGFDAAGTAQLIENPQLLEGVNVQYYMSHLVTSENQASSINPVQRQLLLEIVSKLPPRPVTLANSGGVFLGPDYHFDLARIGKALYGMHPVLGNEGILTPVMELYARVTQVDSHPIGSTVGYDHTHILDRHSRLATIAIGYADGYVRSLSNRGVVYFGEWAAPVVGRVSMDYTIVDVTDVPEDLVYPGAWAGIVNSNQPLNQLGATAGTIARELMVHFDSRHHRIYLENSHG